MKFFADPSEYTHLVRFYGFPAYYRAEGEDGCTIEGTNVVWDWCILRVVPFLYWLITFLRGLFNPFYESEGWEFQIIRPLH